MSDLVHAVSPPSNPARANFALEQRMHEIATSDLPVRPALGVPYHSLDLLLDAADRACACVSFTVLHAATRPPISYPLGEKLDTDVQTLRQDVLLIDTAPAGVDPAAWATMIGTLADTIVAGLRLTDEGGCERWRIRYRDAVTDVRRVHGSLTCGIPVITSPDADWWRRKEQAPFPSFTVHDPMEGSPGSLATSVESPPGDAAAGLSSPPNLGKIEWKLVTILQNRGATSKATSVLLDDLARQLDVVDGYRRGTRRGDHMKKYSQTLSRLGYTTSTRGRGSGIWLTELGAQLRPPCNG
jgi:hypothetical protein